MLDAGRPHCRPQSGSRSRALTRRRRHALAFTAAERRVIDRLRIAARGAALAERAALQQREGRRNAAQLPRRRRATARRTASRPRSRPPSSSSSTAIRRSSSASNRSTCSITSSSCTAGRTAGDRWRARATLDCTARKPVFATPRALALSYFDAYIDFTGRIKAYAVVDLRVLGQLRLAVVGEATSGRWSDCCSTGRIGAIRSSKARERAMRAPVPRVPRGAWITSRGNSIARRDRWTRAPGRSSTAGTEMTVGLSPDRSRASAW